MRQVEPTRIAKGERAQWSRYYCDYPATEYDLQYRFRGTGPGVNVDATASGDDFVSEITAVQSATLTAGRYRWQAWLTEKADATNTFVQASGYITIETGFTEGETGDIDLRSPAKIALDSIDAAMAAFATSDVQEYEISTPSGTRRVKRSARQDLLNLRKYYATIVGQENARDRVAQGGTFAPQVKVNMFER